MSIIKILTVQLVINFSFAFTPYEEFRGEFVVMYPLNIQIF